MVFLAKTLSFLGEPSFHTLFWPLLALLIRRPQLIHLGLTTFFTGASVTFLKIVTGRARPQIETAEWIGFTFQNHYHSFPSGHAALSFALAACIASQYPEWKFPLFALAFLISLSRLFLGCHHLTDVLCGAFLGLTINYLGVLWTKNMLTTPSTPSS